MKNITPKQDKQCHESLPIDKDEKVLGLYKHHILAYILPILGAFLVIIVLLGLALLLTTTKLGQDAVIADQYHVAIFGMVFVLSIGAIVFTFIPVWLRSQEHIVLTDEALLQVLLPGLFDTKISQTSLERISDVTVHEDFLGTMFGYGALTVETSGEQDNYEYLFLPQARDVARQIIESQEEFMIALEGGHLQPKNTIDKPQNITIDSKQYQEFLQFQKQKTDTAQSEKTTSE